MWRRRWGRKNKMYGALRTPKQENVTLRWGQNETFGRGLEGSVWGAVLMER